MIRDKLIASMKGFNDLEEYIEKTEDAALRLIVDIVKKYHRNLPHYIRQIKEAHVENHEKGQAGMIFSTVHRCKGLEYDEVTLADDFISEDKVIKWMNEGKGNSVNIHKITEEINLLYVAVTRTRNVLNIPEGLLPRSRINVITEAKKPSRLVIAADDYFRSKKPPKSVQEKNKSGQPWTREDDDILTVMYCEGKPLNTMARKLGRGPGAIRSRISKLELPELYD